MAGAHRSAELPLMPFYVLSGIPSDLPALPRVRAALLRTATVIGGPFATRERADHFVQGYLAAQRRQCEAMLGVTLPSERYEVASGVDVIAAICAALGLPDPSER